VRRLVGLDLNGLWDRAAVWTPEDDRVEDRDAGINGSVVRLISDDVLIGGRQAELAPHGRGPGWGPHVGGAYRVRVAELLARIQAGETDEDARRALVALVDGLCPDTRSVLMAVRDVPAIGEAARDALLAVLREAAASGAALIWRPMAAILGWLEGPAGPPEGVRDGMRICVVSLLRDGVDVADARLIAGQGAGPVLWTPERRRGGRPAGDLAGAVAMACRFAEDAARDLDLAPNVVLETTVAPWRVAVGRRVNGELVRLPNRSWRRMPRLHAPAPPAAGPVTDPEVLDRVRDAEVVLVEGPGAGNAAWAAVVLRALGLDEADPKLRRCDPEVVARGCLAAERRRQESLPAWFDFLPQLEINALVGDRADFVPLIRAGERLSGGERYVGRAAGAYALDRGATELTFYLVKEDEPRPRRAKVDLGDPPAERHAIDVTVEQSPGQGFARIRIASDTYLPFRAAPVDLVWSAMEPVEDDRATLLDKLSHHARSDIPETVTVPGHPIHWHPGHSAGDLRAMLLDYLAMDFPMAGHVGAKDVRPLERLRGRVAKPCSPVFEGKKLGLQISERRSRRAIAGNGAVPAGETDLPVPADAGDLLDRALAKAAAEFGAIMDGRVETNDTVLGHFVGFATWCNQRCPPEIVDHLLAMYPHGGSFALNHVLKVEGIGRAIARGEHARDFLTVVEGQLQAKGGLTSQEFAAVAHVLGGVPSAAERLSSGAAGGLLVAVTDLIEAENQKPKSKAYKRKFKNALKMLAGLLRYRLQERDFLVPDRDPEADRVVARLEETRQRLTDFAKTASIGKGRFERAADIIAELLHFIRLERTDPNILVRIDDMEE